MKVLFCPGIMRKLYPQDLERCPQMFAYVHCHRLVRYFRDRESDDTLRSEVQRKPESPTAIAGSPKK